LVTFWQQKLPKVPLKTTSNRNDFDLKRAKKSLESGISKIFQDFFASLVRPTQKMPRIFDKRFISLNTLCWYRS